MWKINIFSINRFVSLWIIVDFILLYDTLVIYCCSVENIIGRKIQKRNIPRFVGKKLCHENAFHGLSCVGCNLNTYKHHSVINHLHSMYTCAACNQVYYVRNNQNLQRMFFSIKGFHMNRIFGASRLLISMEWSRFRFLRIDKNFNFCIAFRLLFVNWFKAHVSR